MVSPLPYSLVSPSTIAASDLTDTGRRKDATWRTSAWRLSLIRYAPSLNLKRVVRLYDDPRILHALKGAMSDVPRSALHDRLAARHQVVYAATASVAAQAVISVLPQPFLDNLLDVHLPPPFKAEQGGGEVRGPSAAPLTTLFG
jgi:hypothetical protein